MKKNEGIQHQKNENQASIRNRADIDRLYIPRKIGGRGQISIKTSYIIAVESFLQYLKLGQIYEPTKKNKDASLANNREENPKASKTKK